MAGHAVIVAGGGPTGLMLAAELALAGVDVAIVERRANQDIVGVRARGLQARTLEILEQRGIAERFLAAGRPAQVAGFAGVRIDIADFPSRHPYGLALVQKHTERLLLGWAEELGVPIHRRREVTGFDQDDTGVDVHRGEGTTLRAQYLVGCDGGRSLVRKAAGIDFAGSGPTISHILAQAHLAEEPEWGFRRDAIGTHAISRAADDGHVEVMVTERSVEHAREPTLRDLSRALVAVYGTDYGIHEPISISRFTDASRQAVAYRHGRVLLAGDAAHIHYPAGGQGLNLGLQDAVNLGWKLAQVVNGAVPDTLLDTYHAERHPVGARVLRETMAFVALARPDDRSEALRGFVADLARMDEPRRYLGGMLSGLDIRYDLGDGHPLLGRRMPDLELGTAGGSLRVSALLHRARPILIDLGNPPNLDIAPWADRVQRIEAACAGPWELPVVGAVAVPNAVLVRPDGYVAWVGDGSDAGLADALTRWFGGPAPKPGRTPTSRAG